MEKEIDNKYHCIQCGKEMGIIEYIVGSVCKKCCNENHAAATGRSIKPTIHKKGRRK